MKLYVYYWDKKYYLSEMNPNDYYESNNVLAALSLPCNVLAWANRISIRKWKSLTKNHSGEIEFINGKNFKSSFPTLNNVQQFLESIEPYIIMSEIMGDEYEV